MIDTPATYLVPLRIKFKNKRRYSDDIYIQIDEAIDAVGRNIFSSRWGMSEIWREAPFVYLSKTHRLKRLKFHANRKLGQHSFGGGYFRDECHFEKSEAKSVSDDIKNAFKLLRRSIEDGTVKCFKSTKKNGTLPFKSKDFERLRRQQDTALYSGRLKGPRNSVHVIQVQQESLRDWIRRGCPSERLIDAPMCLYREITALILSSGDLTCIISRDSLAKLISHNFQAHGYRLSKKQFNDSVWKKLPEDYKKPGRKGSQRDREQLSAWNLFKHRIQESVESCRKRSLRDGN